MPSDGSRPSDLARTKLADGREVDFVVRQERGTINRFLYSYAMLAPRGEDPARPDLSLWNRRLLYYFQGGVAIGHSQGQYNSGALNPDVLGQGYAIVYSSGNNTGTHYNLQVAGETALMTKEGFVERYGVPLYTVGLGGSGGAIQQLMEPAGVMDAVQWTHYDDLRNIYGVDERGDPRPTWDNVGVQYGLRSMKEGKITPAEFLDLNFKVGGWKHPRDMVQEGFPFFGTGAAQIAAVQADPSLFDPWSRRNMNLSADPANVPAPRTKGDPIAMRAAYTSGMVFTGDISIPTIDHRQYLERELDMHNAHQSFAVRKRVIQKKGDSDHLVIWFTDTRPGAARASQSLEALAVMDEWMANIRANPTRSVAQNRPARAVDSCFDVQGKLMQSGAAVWDGVLNDRPQGACTAAFPLYSTSRIVAGAPLEGGIYRCALKPVDTAVADGTYAPWVPSAADVARLKLVFPEGVCDYGRPDQARPS